VNADEQRIEALLRSAAATVSWPVTPDLRPVVLARIAEGASPVTATGPGRVPRRVVLVRSVLVALLALIVLAGVATALGFRLPGLDIMFVERLPPAGTGLDLGSPVPLAEVRDGESPRVLVPAALPEPESAFVLGAGDRRMVTLAWRAAPGERTLAGGDLSLTLMAVPGSTDEGFLTKLLGPGTTIEPVGVGGDRGWWIAGAAHDLLVERPDGTVGLVTVTMAGDTLVFARDGTLYRLESALGRDRTLEIASSLR
jgi:hypothetical protein